MSHESTSGFSIVYKETLACRQQWLGIEPPTSDGWMTAVPPEQNKMKIFRSQIVYFKIYLYSERVKLQFEPGKLHSSFLVVILSLGLGTSLSKTNLLIPQHIIEEMLCHEGENWVVFLVHTKLFF